MKYKRWSMACLLMSAAASAAEISVSVNVAEKHGSGAAVGVVRIVETPYGLAFYPALKGLSPGLHGFHIHENPSCGPSEKEGVMIPALAAGGHFDPKGSKNHGEPWGDGHLGDLPPLYVAADGTSVSPVHSPRLKLPDVRNRSIMILISNKAPQAHGRPPTRR